MTTIGQPSEATAESDCRWQCASDQVNYVASAAPACTSYNCCECCKCAWTYTTTTSPQGSTTTLLAGGTLFVSSSPEDATVYVNGEQKGMTPSVNTLPAGKYTVKLALSGYREYVKKATVKNGQTATVDATLKAIPVGTLVVNSDPAGVSVSLNGGAKGNTPLTLANLPVRKYTVQLSLTGYKNYKKKVNVRNGQETSVDAKLKPIK